LKQQLISKTPTNAIDVQTKTLREERKTQAPQAISLFKRHDARSQKLSLLFDQLNVGIFIELERVKRPSTLLYSACLLFCKLVSAFRDKLQEPELDSWPSI